MNANADKIGRFPIRSHFGRYLSRNGYFCAGSTTDTSETNLDSIAASYAGRGFGLIEFTRTTPPGTLAYYVKPTPPGSMAAAVAKPAQRRD